MYCVVDIETTGGNGHSEKITEVAIYVYDGEKIVDEFVSLVNPERAIPPFITQLTGITNEMVEDAPKFYEIAKRIIEITDNRVFVAHNVSFDYRFMQHEFKSLGYDFVRDQICTVKLSRKVLPGHKSYSLGNLCNDLGIELTDRHRASGDAKATVTLLDYLLKYEPNHNNLFSETSTLSNKGLHPKFDLRQVAALPDQCGVYYFLNEKEEIIYIGKSKSIKKRILSHFNAKTQKAMEMRNELVKVEYELTGSELIALLLESEQVKDIQPKYNRALKNKFQGFGLYQYEDKLGYRCLVIQDHKRNDTWPLLLFKSKQEGKNYLSNLAMEKGLCQVKCNIDSNINEEGKPCFYHQIKQCDGACIGAISADHYNERISNVLSNIHIGASNCIISDIGRTPNENAIVLIEDGRYRGYGYISKDDAVQINYTEQAYDFISLKENNRDTHFIVKQFLNKYSDSNVVLLKKNDIF